MNADEYEAFFRTYLQEGKDVLHVTLSSGISGTINSAQNAALIVRERYPERKIYILDSLGAIELLVALQDNFGVSIAPTELEREEMTTVNLIIARTAERM